MKDAKDNKSGEIVPRNLRVLVIDDEEKDPSPIFPNFKLVGVPDRRGMKQVVYVSRWVQLLGMLARLNSVDFDLLSIDVKFHHDDSDAPTSTSMCKASPTKIV